MPDIAVFELFGHHTSLWMPLGQINLVVFHLFMWVALVRSGSGFSRALLLVAAWATGLAVGAATVNSVLPALIGAALAFEVSRRLLGWRKPFSHILVQLLILTLIIGRTGCLFGGCCFGTPTDMPWGILYPLGYFARNLHDHAVHPVQAYELAFLLAALAATHFLARRPSLRPSLLWYFLGAYLLQRVALEPIRAMSHFWWSTQMWGVLSVFQWALLTLGTLALFIGWRQQRLPALFIARSPEPANISMVAVVLSCWTLLLCTHLRVPWIVETIALTFTVLGGATVATRILLSIPTHRWLAGPTAAFACLVLLTPFAVMVYAQTPNPWTSPILDTAKASPDDADPGGLYEADSAGEHIVKTADGTTALEDYQQHRLALGLDTTRDQDSLRLKMFRRREGTYRRLDMSWETLQARQQEPTANCNGPSVYYDTRVSGGSLGYHHTNADSRYSNWGWTFGLGYWEAHWTRHDEDAVVMDSEGNASLFAWNAGAYREWTWFGIGFGLASGFRNLGDSDGLAPPDFDSSATQFGVPFLFRNQAFQNTYLRVGHPVLSLKVSLVEFELLSRHNGFDLGAGFGASLSESNGHPYLRASLELGDWYVAPRISTGDAQDRAFSLLVGRFFQ